MKKRLFKNSIGLHGIYQIFLIMFCLECVVAIIYLISFPSESSYAILAGFSLRRILICLVILVMLGGTIIILKDSTESNGMVIKLFSKLGFPPRNYFIFSLIQIVLTLSLFLCVFYLSFAFFRAATYNILSKLIPFIFYYSDNLFLWLGQWAKFLILWISLTLIKLIILLFLFKKRQQVQNIKSHLVKLTATAWTITAFLFLLYIYRDDIVFSVASPSILLPPLIKICILATWLTVWSLLRRLVFKRDKYSIFFICVSIWLGTFLLYLQMAQWLHASETPIDNYFNLLAEAFLHGKIYINNPPTTHDMNFFQGKWYVSFPPFPAMLMLPFVAFWGVAKFNTVTFSLTLAASTSVFVFLTMHQLVKFGWINLSYRGMTWLVALFSFGTVAWWLATTSRSALFSQTCTILFCSLSFWLALKEAPPWLVGFCLGAAILCRPNVFLLFPSLIAITIQIEQDHGGGNWRRILKWGIAAGIPILIGALLLLYYNYLRFGNFLNFGYQTLNGSEMIVERAQQYGIFNFHFIPENLSTMFLASTWHLIAQCKYFLPRGNGMSIFLTTPAFIYLFRKFTISWWIGGCWCSIILSTLLLAMYHNTGAIQYGYRYVMDFIIPIIMIIAFNAGKKVSTPLKVLIIISILINYYGTLSWFRSPC